MRGSRDSPGKGSGPGHGSPSEPWADCTARGRSFRALLASISLRGRPRSRAEMLSALPSALARFLAFLPPRPSFQVLFAGLCSARVSRHARARGGKPPSQLRPSSNGLERESGCGEPRWRLLASAPGAGGTAWPEGERGLQRQENLCAFSSLLAVIWAWDSHAPPMSVPHPIPPAASAPIQLPGCDLE